MQLTFRTMTMLIARWRASLKGIELQIQEGYLLYQNATFDCSFLYQTSLDLNSPSHFSFYFHIFWFVFCSHGSNVEPNNLTKSSENQHPDLFPYAKAKESNGLSVSSWSENDASVPATSASDEASH